MLRLGGELAASKQDKHDYETISQELNNKLSKLRHEADDDRQKATNLEDVLQDKENALRAQEAEIRRMDAIIGTLE